MVEIRISMFFVLFFEKFNKVIRG
jgi:hypothetical protein